MWGEVSREVGEARERELSGKFFKPVLELGARMICHHNTVQSAHDIIRGIIANPPIVLRIQRELVDECKDIGNTTAGESINAGLNGQIRRHQVELMEVLEEMVQALKEKDEETRQELQEEARRLQERTMEITKNLEGMAGNYTAEKERMRARMKGMEQGPQRRERDEADHTHRPQDEINVSVVDQPGLKQQVKRSQDFVGILATTPAKYPSRRDNPPRPSETERVDRNQYQLPPTAPRVPSPRVPSVSTP